MGPLLKLLGILALDILVIFVFILACALRLQAVINQSLLRWFRVLFHTFLPFLTVMFLINVGWRVALVSLFVWAAVLAVTPFYIELIERPVERAESVKQASSGEEPVIYLRSFAAAETMCRIEGLLEKGVSSFAARDNPEFKLNPVALGHDDRAGFPKLTTTGGDWWQRFKDLTATSAVIFLLPMVAHVNPKAGIARETAYVFSRHMEKLIVVVPDADTWERLPRAPGESFDAVTWWNEVRDSLRSVRPSVSFPGYLSSGFVFYMVYSGVEAWTCVRFSLSTTGVRYALSAVTRKRRRESRERWQEAEHVFYVSNGMTISEYYSRPGVKPEPNLWLL